MLGADVVEVGTLEKKFGGTALGRTLAVARTVLEGALANRRSRGCHYRLDAEERIALADLPR